MEAAREFIQECAKLRKHTVIVPDKDADGLSSALIIYRLLALLGLPEECLHVHFLSKGHSIHSDSERSRLEETLRNCFPDATAPQEAAIIIVDQGSRPARPVVRSNAEEGCGEHVHVKTLIIDHHQATEWPEEAQYVTACRSSPISTSSLLTYLICFPLHADVPTTCDWLALIGIFGDLGPSEIKFGDESGEWPVTQEFFVLKDACKREGKKNISDAVGMLNARELRTHQVVKN
jgi:single-stranded DNA-specific DHH superfamily exonuclease